MKSKIFRSLFTRAIWAGLFFCGACNVQGGKSAIDSKFTVNPGNARTQSLSEGLVAFWHFEENSGSTFLDSGTGVNSLSISGGTFTPGVSGRIGNALRFDGAGAECTVPDHTFDTGIATVSFWLKWDGGDNEMPFSFNPYNIWFDGGYFGFNTANSDLFSIDSSPLAGVWHHLAIVFHANDYSQNLIYLDGASQTLAQASGSINPSGAQLTREISFGYWLGDHGRFFNGVLDEAGIWNRELNSTEVNLLYTQGYP